MKQFIDHFEKIFTKNIWMLFILFFVPTFFLLGVSYVLIFISDCPTGFRFSGENECFNSSMKKIYHIQEEKHGRCRKSMTYANLHMIEQNSELLKAKIESKCGSFPSTKMYIQIRSNMLKENREIIYFIFFIICSLYPAWLFVSIIRWFLKNK